MFQRLKDWWRGEFRETPLSAIFEGEPRGPEFIRPPLVKALVAIGKFLAKEWKWIIGFMVAIIGLYIAYLKL